MEARTWYSDPLKASRRDAYERVDMRKRQGECVDALRKYSDMTAREIAFVLKVKGILPTDERNFVAPD